jgi:hypothetical protein
MTSRKRVNTTTSDEQIRPPPRQTRRFTTSSTTPHNIQSSSQDNRPPFSQVQNMQNYQPNRPDYMTGSNAVSSMRSRSRLPRLSDEECEILDLHHGCKKCRRCYVQHDHNSCPNDFPDGSGYRQISFELAADFYKASQVPGYDAFHGVDISRTPKTAVAPVFAWASPSSNNPLVHCSAARSYHPPPHPYAKPTFRPPTMPPRAMQPPRMRSYDHSSFNRT